MSPFACLLVPLDGSRAAAASLGCGTWLASRLEAKLHILSATMTPLPAREELARLRVPEGYWSQIILHQAPQFPEEAILAAIEELNADLIVMSASGEGSEKRLSEELGAFGIGHVTRAVIEQSAVPVLLLPGSYREDLPWRHALVPMSGESETDDALSLAVTLANALELEVHIVHVMDGAPHAGGLATATHYADAMHHEYPQQLGQLVRRTLPHLSVEECRCITDVALARGEIASEVFNIVTEKHVNVVVVGWHGRFMTGHAEVLKELLEVITCPILLVKPARRPAFELKVGEEMEKIRPSNAAAAAAEQSNSP